MVPVYKKKERSKVDNYRPVSLLPVASKVMETIVNQQIVNFLESQGVFSENQFGFRGLRGTEDLLAALNNEWIRTLAGGGCVRVLAADIAGAFDKVSHRGVLHKAEACGLSGQLLAWLAAYLDERTLRAVLNGFASDAYPVAAGVPQGSVLGPTLFLLYVNDLEDQLPAGARLAVYADDTTIYALIHAADDLHASTASLQAALDAYSAWCAVWHITLEPSKSHALTLHRRQTPPELPPLVLCGVEVPEVDELRLLGVQIDARLTYGPHLDAVAARGRQRLGFLRRVRHLLPPRGLATVYKAFVRPVLEFGMLTWMGAAPTHLRKLDAVQDAALALIGPCDDDLGIDPLAHRRRVGALTYLYKLRSWDAPSRLQRLVPAPLARAPRRTRVNAAEFDAWHPAKFADMLPLRSPAYLARAFPFCVVEVWNALPASFFVAGFALSGVQAFKVAVHRHFGGTPPALHRRTGRAAPCAPAEFEESEDPPAAHDGAVAEFPVPAVDFPDVFGAGSYNPGDFPDLDAYLSFLDAELVDLPDHDEDLSVLDADLAALDVVLDDGGDDGGDVALDDAVVAWMRERGLPVPVA